MKLTDIIHHDVVIHLDTLKTDPELVKQIQTQLNRLGFYPGGSWLDGAYGQRTEQAMTDFSKSVYLNNRDSNKFGKGWAQKLLPDDTKSLLSLKDTDKETIYKTFLKESVKGSIDEPALFYKGIDTSAYKTQIKDYAARLMQKPDGKTLVSVTKDTTHFQPFPPVGQLPDIDDQGLSFLHPEITEACLCVGGFVNGDFKTKWLGRNALSKTEFWSSSKIIPILNVVSRSNTNAFQTDIDTCLIRGRDLSGQYREYSFHDVLKDILSYENRIASSNSLAAMLKQFSTPAELENWLKSMTGNQNLIFTGRYGEEPLIPEPELSTQPPQGWWRPRNVILKGVSERHRGENTITAYDLTRMISMLGWHYHIPQSSRLPGAQWHSLESVIRAMGADAARLTDGALDMLNLQDKISAPVIISKLGNGVTQMRNRAEAVYVALVQFIQPSTMGVPELVTFSMALKGAKRLEPRDAKREVVELDARMATEVTEIIRRGVLGELG
ncbi:MAG: peptidoglycan-binding domain-containing protein [Coleofasciculus sp. G1-WW12-02]|uniref:peptidoglycan-binding domain-containing protein n=1 Tax=Coleofasciculus sp. G1-WW12-02 TaxID=3068483 RepID=UPI0033007ABE